MNDGVRVIGPGELKALVRQLVDAAGGVDACGVELGVSRERVSQWQRVTCDDQMPTLAIIRLERVVGRAIVTGAAAKAVEGVGGAAEAMGGSAVDTVGASAGLLSAVHEMDADGVRDVGEIRRVQEAAAAIAREGLEAVIASAALKPGAVQ